LPAQTGRVDIGRTVPTPHDAVRGEGDDQAVIGAEFSGIVDVVLELWAVIIVAGSAGALASFFQSADR
jgi:hypothetical protein